MASLRIPFLDKVLGHVVSSQPQMFQDHMDYLHPIQSGCISGSGTETALVTLVDFLCQELGRENVSLLILLNLLTAFDTISYGTIVGLLSGRCLGGIVLLLSFLEGQAQKGCLFDTLAIVL